MSLCQCGCGGVAPLAKQSETKRGYVKGQPMRFIPGHNMKGKVLPAKKYRTVRAVGHPKEAGSGETVYEHVLIAEKALGRYMPDGAEVHHVDGDSSNNANSNLVICQDKAYHKLLHVRTRVLLAGGNPNTDLICSKCGPRHRDEFWNSSRNQSGKQSTCRACLSKRWDAA